MAFMNQTYFNKNAARLGGGISFIRKFPTFTQSATFLQNNLDGCTAKDGGGAFFSQGNFNVKISLNLKLCIDVICALLKEHFCCMSLQETFRF